MSANNNNNNNNVNMNTQPIRNIKKEVKMK